MGPGGTAIWGSSVMANAPSGKSDDSQSSGCSGSAEWTVHGPGRLLYLRKAVMDRLSGGRMSARNWLEILYGSMASP